MTSGLWVFVTCWGLSGLGLLLDLWLLDGCGCRTITSVVWEYPSVGLPIIAAQIIGLIGLLCHFYGGE